MTTVYLSHRKVNSTRKPHRCYGCGRLFPAKSSLFTTSQVDEEEVYSLYFCNPCWNYTETNRDIDWENINEGDIGFWENDQWYPVDQDSL